MLNEHGVCPVPHIAAKVNMLIDTDTDPVSVTGSRPLMGHCSPCARPNIVTKHVNRFHCDFLLAHYLKCPKMVDGPLYHFAKCHFGGHL